MATSATTIDLQILRFHNCGRCIHKVKRALRKIQGVRLIESDPENGIFTISTVVKNTDEIRADLQKKFDNKTIILLPKKKPINSSAHQSNSCVRSREGSVDDFMDMTEMLTKLPGAERLKSVELGQNVLKVKYYEKQPINSSFENVPLARFEYVTPPFGSEPSAPLLPVMESCVYGYPVGSYGYSTTSTDDYTHCCCCCPIM